MYRLYFVIIGFVFLFSASCKKAENVQEDLKGRWERIVFEHNGKENWIFTANQELFITFELASAGIHGDTAAQGTYEIDIVNYSHGRLLNKNILRVPSVTITGLTNFRYNARNYDYTPYNTKWEVHELNENVLIITTQEYSGIKGGLVIREFIRIE